LWFDFHKVASTSWAGLSQILSITRDTSDTYASDELELMSSGDTVSSRANGEINNNKLIFTRVKMTNEQKGVYRINCFDSLDRTNLIQCIYARDNAECFIKKHLPNFTSTGEFLKGFNSDISLMWVENANALSKSYTCTSSLKTDFTLNGVRTKYGVINDGINSSLRHY